MEFLRYSERKKIWIILNDCEGCRGSPNNGESRLGPVHSITAPPGSIYCTKGMPKSTRLEELSGSRYGLLYVFVLAAGRLTSLTRMCGIIWPCDHAS